MTEPIPTDESLPDWAQWKPSAAYTVGVEEEVMVLNPTSWALARDTDQVLSGLSVLLGEQVTQETHQASLELSTAPYADVTEVADEAAALRLALAEELARDDLRAAAAGLHPFVSAADVQVSGGARYQSVYETMRELARRDPTYALHVHVGVPDPETAVDLLDRLRVHLPLLLALSGNSPFWQGRDSGLSSMRTPIFQAFPRTGIPRRFGSYTAYVEVVAQMVHCGAIPEPTFLWWDVRLQPALGTVEVRVMDTQSTVWRTESLVALIQSVARLECEEGYAPPELTAAGELLAENRFLAARDGMDAELIDPVRACLVPAREQLARLLVAARPHAQDLDCLAAFDSVIELAARTGAQWQRRLAEKMDLPEVVEQLADAFTGRD